jgi:hypothetical protein
MERDSKKHKPDKKKPEINCITTKSVVVVIKTFISVAKKH